MDHSVCCTQYPLGYVHLRHICVHLRFQSLSLASLQSRDNVATPMKVLILGAGVAGVASAWYFWRDGHDVTVVERNAGVALETSFANGGQLSYSYLAPLASPSGIPKIPPWLLRRDSPLPFTPELDPDPWRWILEVLAACDTRTTDGTTQRLLRPFFFSRALT